MSNKSVTITLPPGMTINQEALIYRSGTPSNGEQLIGHMYGRSRSLWRLPYEPVEAFSLRIKRVKLIETQEEQDLADLLFSDEK